MDVREQPQSMIPIAGELLGRFKNQNNLEDFAVTSTTQGLEIKNKPIDEVLVLNPEARELFLLMCGRIASAEIPVGNFGMHVLNTPQQESVEIIGTNINRDDNGEPINGNEILLTLLDAQKIAKDELTGAYNRSVLISKMEALQAKGIPFSILMGDMDRFKNINDTFGHVAGDKSLQELAQRMATCLRTGKTGELKPLPEDPTKKANRINDSVVGRFGGDEFIALLPNCPQDGLLLVENRLNQSLASYNQQAKIKGEAEISISMAGASIGELPNGFAITDLIKLADRRMFNIKMDKRIGNVSEMAEQYLGANISDKILFIKDILSKVDFSFSKMMPSQIIISAINDYLLNYTYKEIMHKSQIGEIDKIEPLLKLRSGIPSALGIREDTQERENFQVIMNDTTESIIEEIFKISSKKEKKEKLLKLLSIEDSANNELKSQLISNAIFELNKRPLPEV